MEIIRNANAAEIGCLGKQVVNTNKEYRAIAYSLRVECEDGLLLYNNLTNELLLLNTEEQAELEKQDITSEAFKTLIEKWFFVPKEHNDVKLCNQLNSFMRMVTEAASSNTPITQYGVFTTTDCNARCFYCFEAGRKRINMTEKTASDVADFIIKSCRGEKVTFRWFGGEPLYNSVAIDIICTKLRDSGIDFQSGMVSNGYLFDEAVVQKAVGLWNLQQVQITLDGTEEVYNRCKAFIYKDCESPYKRVMRNIELLLKAGINVKIRMNADEHNMEDLYALTDILHNKFGGDKNLTVYSHLIFEDTGNNRNRTAEKQREIFVAHAKLVAYINSKGFETKYNLHDYLRYQQCMADCPSATTILPDGHLGRCEHFSEDNFYGSIYSDEKDYEVINRFKKVWVMPECCDNCPVRPSCLQLEECPDLPKQPCTDYLLKSYIINLRNRILNTYIEYKTGESQKTDLWD